MPSAESLIGKTVGNYEILRELDVSENAVTDLTPIIDLTQLTRFEASDNQIEDISPLVRNPGFNDGHYIDLTDNPLSPKALAEDIPALIRRGVEVQYDP